MSRNSPIFTHVQTLAGKARPVLLVATLLWSTLVLHSEAVLLAQEGTPESAQRTAVDAYGDALPAGAFSRLGTTRFRRPDCDCGWVIVSPDGRTIASTTGVIQLWDAATGAELHRIEAGGPIAFTADGNTLMATKSDGFGFWDVSSGRLVQQSKIRSVVAWGPVRQGKRLAATRLNAGAIAIWELESPLQIQIADSVRETSQICRRINVETRDGDAPVVFSADGSMLAVADKDHVIRVFDCSTGKELQSFVGHLGTIWSLDFSPDGKRLASGGSEGYVGLWNMASVQGEFVARLRKSALRVRFSPDGKFLAYTCGEGIVRIGDGTTGQMIWELPYDEIGPVGRLEFFPTSDKLVTAGNSCLQIWDLKNRKEITPPAEHRDRITTLAFAPKRDFLASGSPDGTVRLWDYAKGKRTQVLSVGAPVECLAVSRAGRQVVSGDRRGSLYVWDVAAEEATHRFSAHFAPVRAVLYEADDKVIVSAGEDGRIRFWDADKGVRLREIDTGDNRISAVAMLADGQTLAAATIDGIVTFWEAKTGKKLRTTLYLEKACHSLAVSPDGKVLAVGLRPGQIKLVGTETREVIGEITQLPAAPPVLVFAANSKVLVIGVQRKLVFWDLATKQLLHEMNEFTADITSLALSPDGKTLSTGHADTTVLCWRMGEIIKNRK